MATIYQFADKEQVPTLAEVGGKGFSLIKMFQADLAIPPGFILAVQFFQPWIDDLKKTSAWRDFLGATKESMSEKIMAVKAYCATLKLTTEQQTALNEAFDQNPRIQLFAVRSSSPEEDLAGASFAGGYETVLGVTRRTMVNAIKKAFASCLDSRVFIYKKEQGFATNEFSIAVVIMEQIASEIAGIGFSINPITNDYDEFIFNANWGLGETVVSGVASPDQFVVNKIQRKIINKQLGNKETSTWLLDDGRIEERPDERRNQFSLTDQQLFELTGQLCRIEKLFDCPMDIEWAYANEQLYLLQARPITTWIPLPSGMTTDPNEPRRLYLDVTLSVQGLEKPISPLGIDFIDGFIRAAAKKILGRDDVIDVKDGVVSDKDGKLYLNLSNLFTLVNKHKLADQLIKMDAIASEILRQLEPGAYQRKKKPRALHLNKLAIAIRIFDVIFTVLTGKYRLASLAKTYNKNVESFERSTDDLLRKKAPLYARIQSLFVPLAQFLIHDIFPFLLIGQKALSDVHAEFAEEAQKDEKIKYHLDRVTRSLPHNITIEMGLSIYHLSTYLDKEDYPAVNDLYTAFKTKKLPTDFYVVWDKFIHRFGCRGPNEFDMASPRYVDNPYVLLTQIYSSLMGCNEKNNPLTIYNQSQKEREEAYHFLLKLAEQKGKKAAWRFKVNYSAMVQFGGYRENHKFFLMILLGKVRKQVIEYAKGLVSKGVLSDIKQIFSLNLADLKASTTDPSINLSARIAKNTEVINQLKKIKQTPALIDSRGRILRVKRPSLKPGEIGGHAVSSGIVQGKVKVLHSPNEKPLLVGEILVARATDPGWTPLFVNAAAIVLEVGGMLQHGALVAREYGKPCVAGVENATAVLQDGELIEVDGAAGIIRRLDERGSMGNTIPL